MQEAFGDHDSICLQISFEEGDKEAKKEEVPKPKQSRNLPLEATPGFEPGHKGFADPCLTTWLCRRIFNSTHSICARSIEDAEKNAAGGRFALSYITVTS